MSASPGPIRRPGCPGQFYLTKGGGVSVRFTDDDDMFGGVLSIDDMRPLGLGHWWISRLLVNATFRGRTRVGPELLRLGMAQVTRLGGGMVTVEPGGYGSNVLALRRWYQIQGFEPDPAYQDGLCRRL